MGIIDLLVIITVFLSIMFALYRGLARELLGITAWILAGIAGLYSYSLMQPVMGRFIENQTVAGWIGAMTIALIVLIVMTLINAKITSTLRNSSLSGLDRILGFGFGVFRAWLLITVIYIGVISVDMFHAKMDKLEAENYSLPLLNRSAVILERFIPEDMRKNLQEYDAMALKKSGAEKIGKHIAEDTAKEIKKAAESVAKKAEDKVKSTAKTVEKKVSNTTQKAKETAAEYKKETRQSLDDLIKSVD